MLIKPIATGRPRTTNSSTDIYITFLPFRRLGGAGEGCGAVTSSLTFFLLAWGILYAAIDSKDTYKKNYGDPRFYVHCTLLFDSQRLVIRVAKKMTKLVILSSTPFHSYTVTAKLTTQIPRNKTAAC